MPTTVYLPIDLTNPRVASGYAGNSYWTVISGSNWDMGTWEFISGNEGRVYGIVHIPNVIAGTPNPQISLVCQVPSNASGQEIYFKVSAASVASGTSTDPSLTADTAYSVTAPAARTRFDFLSASGGNLGAAISGNAFLIVEISHSGPNITNVLEALLRVDLS